MGLPVAGSGRNRACAGLGADERTARERYDVLAVGLAVADEVRGGRAGFLQDLRHDLGDLADRLRPCQERMAA